MGRGRAKAKQTKVARALKYNAPETDFDSLRAELTGSPTRTHVAPEPVKEADDEEDEYADHYATDDED